MAAQVIGTSPGQVTTCALCPALVSLKDRRPPHRPSGGFLHSFWSSRLSPALTGGLMIVGASPQVPGLGAALQGLFPSAHWVVHMLSFLKHPTIHLGPKEEIPSQQSLRPLLPPPTPATFGGVHMSPGRRGVGQTEIWAETSLLWLSVASKATKVI